MRFFQEEKCTQQRIKGIDYRSDILMIHLVNTTLVEALMIYKLGLYIRFVAELKFGDMPLVGRKKGRPWQIGHTGDENTDKAGLCH